MPETLIPDCDPATLDDHEALEALCNSPADWLEADYLGAIVADQEDNYDDTQTPSRGSTMFGRINSDGSVDIFDDNGLPATTIDANVYPVGSDVSTRYEHPEGIVLTREDAAGLGIDLEA